MLCDRIVDNKEIGRTIWKIFTAFYNDLYSVERFELRWMICTTLNDMSYVEWSVLPWVICSALNDLNYVEWFLRCWMIGTALNDLYYVEWFAQRWINFYFAAKFVRRRMICAALKDLHGVEWFGVRRMICTTLNHLDYEELLNIDFLMSARCAYSTKYWKIFYTNTDLEIWRRNIFSPAPEIGHKEMFLITIVETIINVLCRHI